LRVCGAELVANQQAEALESAKTSYLNLHSNGVHRSAEHFFMHLDVLHGHTCSQQAAAHKKHECVCLATPAMPVWTFMPLFENVKAATNALDLQAIL
jgi:hypothetical protein